jgi:hypothetical protein
MGNRGSRFDLVSRGAAADTDVAQPRVARGGDLTIFGVERQAIEEKAVGVLKVPVEGPSRSSLVA